MYQIKVVSCLAAVEGPGHRADNCTENGLFYTLPVYFLNASKHYQQQSFKRNGLLTFYYEKKWNNFIFRNQDKMTGQRGKLRALAGICHVHESYF